jgi:hypothetical protein
MDRAQAPRSMNENHGGFTEVFPPVFAFNHLYLSSTVLQRSS